MGGTATSHGAANASWRFIVLAELANFAVLRRQGGKARAGVLIDDVARQIAAVLAPAQLTLIGPLTIWTLKRVIADQAMLAEAGHQLTIFINISGQLLNNPRYIADACDLSTASGARIGFEITETSVIRDPDSAIRNLQLIADTGVPIATTTMARDCHRSPISSGSPRPSSRSTRCS